MGLPRLPPRLTMKRLKIVKQIAGSALAKITMASNILCLIFR